VNDPKKAQANRMGRKQEQPVQPQKDRQHDAGKKNSTKQEQSRRDQGGQLRAS
jgi:hypothetical protein